MARAKYGRIVYNFLGMGPKISLRHVYFNQFLQAQEQIRRFFLDTILSLDVLVTHFEHQLCPRIHDGLTSYLARARRALSVFERNSPILERHLRARYDKTSMEALTWDPAHHYLISQINSASDSMEVVRLSTRILLDSTSDLNRAGLMVRGHEFQFGGGPYRLISHPSTDNYSLCRCPSCNDGSKRFSAANQPMPIAYPGMSRASRFRLRHRFTGRKSTGGGLPFCGPSHNNCIQHNVKCTRKGCPVQQPQVVVPVLNVQDEIEAEDEDEGLGDDAAEEQMEEEHEYFEVAEEQLEEEHEYFEEEQGASMGEHEGFDEVETEENVPEEGAIPVDPESSDDEVVVVGVFPAPRQSLSSGAGPSSSGVGAPSTNVNVPPAIAGPSTSSGITIRRRGVARKTMGGHFIPFDPFAEPQHLLCRAKNANCGLPGCPVNNRKIN